jgi:ubiquinone/menaquinone biosynthesis C-methylase UbiE
MDYDATTVPEGYDRGRSLDPDTLELWMDTVAQFVAYAPRAILDLGCGTGRFSDPLALRFAATVIAVDPSAKMLAQAMGKHMRGAVRLVRGVGEAIPLRDEAVNLVFTSMAYHHFTDAVRVVQECRRVSSSNALTFVRTGTRERTDEYAYVPFIPAARPLIQGRLPSAQHIADIFESAGFATMFIGKVVQQIAPSYQEYADKLEAGGDSVLASVDRSEMKSGIDAIRRYALCVDPLPVTEPIDILVFRTS